MIMLVLLASDPLLFATVMFAAMLSEPKPGVTRQGVDAFKRTTAKGVAGFAAQATAVQADGTQVQVPVDLESAQADCAVYCFGAKHVLGGLESSTYDDLVGAIAPDVPKVARATLEGLVRKGVGLVVCRSGHIIVAQGARAGSGFRTAAHCLCGPRDEAGPLHVGEKFPVFIDGEEYSAEVVAAPEIIKISDTGLYGGVVFLGHDAGTPTRKGCRRARCLREERTRALRNVQSTPLACAKPKGEALTSPFTHMTPAHRPSAGPVVSRDH